MSENNFANIYRTLATDTLLDIVDKPQDYQPLAVEAAQFEIDSRQLTKEQLEAAKEIQSTRQREGSNQWRKVKVVEDGIRSVGSSLAETFNPIKNETPSTDKYIVLISLFTGGLFLYELYGQFGLLTFMFTDQGKWDFSMVLFFLPLLLLPAAAILFWFRKRIGWTLATMYFSYTAAVAIQFFVHELGRKQSDIAAFDTILPHTSPIIYLGSFLLFASVTWLISKEGIRVVYNIDRQRIFITVGIGVAIALLMRFAI